MTHITDSDINRILKVKNADLGLFVLAMHSLMERALKEKYNSESDFGVLINEYTTHQVTTNNNNSFPYILCNFKKTFLYDLAKIANGDLYKCFNKNIHVIHLDKESQ